MVVEMAQQLWLDTAVDMVAEELLISGLRHMLMQIEL
jgi:hypothetical protein